MSDVVLRHSLITLGVSVTKLSKLLEIELHLEQRLAVFKKHPVAPNEEFD